VLNEAQGQLTTFFSRLNVTISEFHSLEMFIIGRSLASSNEQDKTPAKLRNYTPVLTWYSKTHVQSSLVCSHEPYSSHICYSVTFPHPGYGRVIGKIEMLVEPSPFALSVYEFTGTVEKTKKTKLHGLSPRANYTDRETAACRRSDCQLVRIEGATWSAWRIPSAVFLGFLDRSRYFSIK
jgi:hypothetical protein